MELAGDADRLRDEPPIEEAASDRARDGVGVDEDEDTTLYRTIRISISSSHHGSVHSPVLTIPLIDDVLQSSKTDSRFPSLVRLRVSVPRDMVVDNTL